MFLRVKISKRMRLQRVSLQFNPLYSERVNIFSFHSHHSRDKSCCHCNFCSHYLEWGSVPQITGFLVSWGTSVMECLHLVHLLHWQMAEVNIYSLFSFKNQNWWQHCQNMSAFEGWCATNHWLHNTFLAHKRGLWNRLHSYYATGGFGGFFVSRGF